MKKILLLSVLFVGVLAQAQNKKPATPVKKPAAAQKATPAPMKSFMDSVSYALGVSMSKYYAEQGVKNINPNMVAKAIADVAANKNLLLTEQQANQCMSRLFDQVNQSKSKQFQPNIDAGEKFLAENKKRTGVITTASGLQYEVLRQGTGARPGASDQVVAHYAGTLINGAEFDNSYKRGEPITIGVNQVIAGWTEALQLMPVGSKYKLYIPYQLGYGTREAGQIPAGSALVFEVELLEIKGK